MLVCDKLRSRTAAAAGDAREPPAIDGKVSARLLVTTCSWRVRHPNSQHYERSSEVSRGPQVAGRRRKRRKINQHTQAQLAACKIRIFSNGRQLLALFCIGSALPSTRISLCLALGFNYSLLRPLAPHRNEQAKWRRRSEREARLRIARGSTSEIGSAAVRSIFPELAR